MNRFKRQLEEIRVRNLRIESFLKDVMNFVILQKEDIKRIQEDITALNRVKSNESN